VKAKIKRKSSRVARERPKNAGDRWALDLFALEPEGDGNNKIRLLADRYSGFRVAAILNKATSTEILKVIKHWLNKLDILKIKALELDNELAYRPLIKDLLEGRGVTVEPSAPRTQAQRWRRALRGCVDGDGHARFPQEDLNWDTPIHSFYTSVAKLNGTTLPEKPDLSYLKAYVCKAYAMTSEA